MKTSEILINANADNEQIGFHLQQAAEKLLKAILSYNKTEFPKTHNIEDLIEICNNNNIKLFQKIESLTKLTPFAIEFRYNFTNDSLEDPANYLKTLKAFKDWVKVKLSI